MYRAATGRVCIYLRASCSRFNAVRVSRVHVPRCCSSHCLSRRLFRARARVSFPRVALRLVHTMRRIALLGATLVAAGLIALGVRRRRRLNQHAKAAFADRHSPPPAVTPKRLAVFNPRDGNAYNESVMVMLDELFDAMDASVILEELDICKQRIASLLPALGKYDGFIIPGSPASVAAGTAREAPDWVRPMELLVRQLSAKKRPILGICFGHQIMATALGGRVEKNAHGLQAAACSFELTTLGTEMLLTPHEAAGGGSKPVRTLLYHHNDVVCRLPTCAVPLGCSTTNPFHVRHRTEATEMAHPTRLCCLLSPSRVP